jgi:hypothetical protein
MSGINPPSKSFNYNPRQANKRLSHQNWHLADMGNLPDERFAPEAAVLAESVFGSTETWELQSSTARSDERTAGPRIRF